MFTVCVSVVCTRPARTLKDAPNIKYIDDQNSKQRYAELFAQKLDAPRAACFPEFLCLQKSLVLK